ncbi:MAG: FHA domain-containing protein [Planctomyces sp.]|nr:FHA domain-containing protein [Planctomyces sp.]
MPMCLIPMDGSHPVPVDKAVILVGRQQDCDVVIKNSRKVSRRHCCVAQINGEFVVRDLGSMNGVRINGQLIGKEGRIRVGDELHIGDVGYRLAAVDAIPKKGAPGSPPRRPIQTPDPKYLSMDVPVALPEQAQNFAVEETDPRMKAVPKKPSRPPRKTYEVTDDDVIEE